MASLIKSSGCQIAVLTALGFFAGAASPAHAADLGGNCCADLEERIAELEATTARKGNRKVSLTVTGWVNEAIFAYDDGTEPNVYVATNSLEQSRVQFKGEAKIDADWSAGYRLELGFNGGAASNSFTQDDDNGSAASIVIRQSNWFVKNKTYGKLTVGLTGTATYHLLDDVDITNTRNVSDYEAAAVAQGSLFLMSGGSRVNNRRWNDLLRSVNNGSPGQNGRRNVVRYDTAEFMGFTATASWGEDDMAGGALNYKNTLGDFKIAASAGYEHNSDESPTGQACNSQSTNANGGLDCEWYGAGATVMHVPTGLYVYGAWGRSQDDSEEDLNALADGEDTAYFVQAGIEQKFNSLGKTTVFGEYRHDDRGSNIGSTVGAGFGGGFIQSGDVDFFAAGVVQEVDAASTLFSLVYRHAEGDFTTSKNNNFELDDFDMVIAGAKINF